MTSANVELCSSTTAKKSKFCIGHLNICGLFRKIDLVSLFVREHDFDIFGITETLLKESIPTALIDINGYNFERKDRVKEGGGVGVYIKTNIDYLRRNDLARRVKQKSILLKNFVWSSPIVLHPKTYSTFHFKKVLVADVFKHLKKLSRNKATGHDDLPPGMLKNSARFIAAPLAHVICVD